MNWKRVLIGEWNWKRPFKSLAWIYLGPLFPRDRFQNLKLIREMDTPLLVIHGENDEVIPVSHGRKLVDASPASDKAFIPIPDAGRNDLFDFAGDEIIQSIADFARRFAH